VPLAAAVVVNEIQSGSDVSMLTTVKPCNVVWAVKAFCAVPPVVIVPEQAVAVTLGAGDVLPMLLVPAGVGAVMSLWS